MIAEYQYEHSFIISSGMKEQLDETTTMARLYIRIREVMNNEQPFLDPNLTLSKLARIVGTNRTDLSQTLNSQTKANFNKWLSTYRVNHISLQIKAHPEKSLDELFPLSGFSSRTSFFRQFRQVTGKSPREHKEE